MRITTAVQGLDWVALANRSIPAPFKPQIKNELDVSNFSEDFTSMAVTDSPAAVPLDGTKIFRVSLLLLFTHTHTHTHTLIFCLTSPFFHSYSKLGYSRAAIH